MDPFEQTRESLEQARTALQAETRKAILVSRRLNNNLVEAIRRIWRQLLFIWVVVIILDISYLAVLGYTPIITNLAHNRDTGQLSSRAQMETAELPQASPSPLPVVPESGDLLKLLNQIRDAHYKKDIQLFMEAYSPTFPDLGQKRELTLKSWRRYDYLDLQFHVAGFQQKDANTISGIVTWNIKTRNINNNEIETLSKDYNVEFLKESGQWLIQEIEALDNKGKKTRNSM